MSEQKGAKIGGKVDRKQRASIWHVVAATSVKLLILSVNPRSSDQIFDDGLLYFLYLRIF